MKLISPITLLSIFLLSCTGTTEKQPTGYVNPFLGTATLWEPEDLGYVRTWDVRTWGAEVFPGSSLPNAMVQLSPVTQFRSGAGYQYEDTVIYGFSHTNKVLPGIMLPLSVMTTNRLTRAITGYSSKHMVSTWS